jgi:hypothetical protein
MKKATFLFVPLLAACASGNVSIMPPHVTPSTNSKVINKPREAVWNAAVPNLGKRFFVINNLDKSSGLINISYTGDPERFIDCGNFHSTVTNARGTRNYSFPGESANQNYEVVFNDQLFVLNRRMSLEGRMNLVFEEVGPSQTRVTANTRYVVTRNVQIRRIDVAIPQTRTDSISFNSGGRSAFQKGADGQGIECAARGVFEQDVLEVIN